MECILYTSIQPHIFEIISQLLIQAVTSIKTSLQRAISHSILTSHLRNVFQMEIVSKKNIFNYAFQLKVKTEELR